MFSLWRIPGRKRVAHAGSQLNLTAEQGPHRLRASLCTALEDGSPYGLTVPFDTHLRARLSGYQLQANAIQGNGLLLMPEELRARPCCTCTPCRRWMGRKPVLTIATLPGRYSALMPCAIAGRRMANFVRRFATS